MPAVGAGSCPLGRCMDLWPAPWAVHGPPPHVLPPPPTWEFWPCRQPVGQPSRHHPTYCHRRPRNSSGRAGSRSESGCVGAVSRRRRLPATHRHGYTTAGPCPTYIDCPPPRRHHPTYSVPPPPTWWFCHGPRFPGRPGQPASAAARRAAARAWQPAAARLAAGQPWLPAGPPRSQHPQPPGERLAARPWLPARPPSCLVSSCPAGGCPRRLTAAPPQAPAAARPTAGCPTVAASPAAPAAARPAASCPTMAVGPDPAAARRAPARAAHVGSSAASARSGPPGSQLPDHGCRPAGDISIYLGTVVGNIPCRLGASARLTVGSVRPRGRFPPHPNRSPPSASPAPKYIDVWTSAPNIDALPVTAPNA